jgi:hypothetical protein
LYDETWAHYFIRETEQPDMEWRHKNSRYSNNSIQPLSGDIVTSVFLNSEGVILVIFCHVMERLMCSITSTSLFDVFRIAIRKEMPGELPWSVIVFHENACLHMVDLTMTLAILRDPLGGRKFDTDDHMPGILNWPRGQATCFSAGISALQRQWQNVSQ